METESTSAVGTILSKDTLNKMTKPELVNFARVTYGLNLNAEQYPKVEIIDFIMNAGRRFKGNADMRVVKTNDNTVEVPPGYLKIRVSPGEYNPKARPVIIGLNFELASIPVNRDVIVHGKWMPCLEDAVERRYSMGEDDQGHETLVWSDQHKYPFSILVDNR